jgi:RecA-family ATPase
MVFTPYQQQLIGQLTSGEKIDRHHVFDRGTLRELYVIQQDPAIWGLIVTILEQQGIRGNRLETAITDAHRFQNGTGADRFPHPQTATDLLAKTFDPLRCFVDGILAEGLTILAGKPKKGKSYLALDMSLSIAVGRQAFLHFETEQVKVLYVSLEDGERRLQRRLLQIQSNLATPDGLDFLYEFPRLGEGALEAIDYYSRTYSVIIIDVIGRILPPQTPARKSLSEYQEMTDTFGPIQQLAQDRRIAFVMIDHVRKASADDAGDTIMGSQGKFGAADHALIYSRKGEEKDGVLNIMSRDLDEKKFVLTLNEGHLEFLGEGEAFEMDSEQNRIIKILEEERRPMGIQEIMRAMGLEEHHYKRFRALMHRLYNDDRIGRTNKRGLYTLYGHDRHLDDLDEIKFA